MNGHKNKLGVLGGLFDPIHYGHLALCRNARIHLQLEKILLVPAYHPPHRAEVSAYGHRLNMVKLAVRNEPGLEASDLESDFTGPSFTVRTLKRLKKLYPGSELFFIIGSDNLSKMEEWYHPEKIFRLAKVAMGNRPGESNLSVGEFANLITRFEMKPMAISSTEIRECVRHGQPLSELVPPEIEKYITEHKLYV